MRRSIAPAPPFAVPTRSGPLPRGGDRHVVSGDIHRIIGGCRSAVR